MSYDPLYPEGALYEFTKTIAVVGLVCFFFYNLVRVFTKERKAERKRWKETLAQLEAERDKNFNTNRDKPTQ